MARKLTQATIDEEQFVEVRVRIPMPLHRTLTAYCAFRGFDVQTLPLVTRSLIRAYFAANDPFQRWLRQHPDAVAGAEAGALEGAAKAGGERRRVSGEPAAEARE
jgi:hypothetical protein